MGPEAWDDMCVTQREALPPGVTVGDGGNECSLPRHFCVLVGLGASEIGVLAGTRWSEHPLEDQQQA